MTCSHRGASALPWSESDTATNADVVCYKGRMRTFTVLLAVTLLGFAAACGSKDDLTMASGAELFERQACATCHAKDGSGSSLAPTLHGKKQHWSRETLLAYLVDPVGYAKKDPRLHAQGSKYSQAMPTYKMLPPWALESLADHVLTMP